MNEATTTTTGSATNEEVPSTGEAGARLHEDLDEESERDTGEEVGVGQDADALRAEVEMLRKHELAIREMAEKIAELQREHEAAKAQARAAKDRLDAASERLTCLALQRPSYGTLFEEELGGVSAAWPIARAKRSTPAAGDGVDRPPHREQ